MLLTLVAQAHDDLISDLMRLYRHAHGHLIGPYVDSLFKYDLSHCLLESEYLKLPVHQGKCDQI